VGTLRVVATGGDFSGCALGVPAGERDDVVSLCLAPHEWCREPGQASTGGSSR
jgi:hypothetical protein